MVSCFIGYFRGGISTYKELCSIASDLNQPDLIYKFMHLANHNALWNSRKVRQAGFLILSRPGGGVGGREGREGGREGAGGRGRGGGREEGRGRIVPVLTLNIYNFRRI